MKVLLTGGTGFVGPAAATALHAAGHRVRCLVRGTSDRSGLEATGVEIEWALGDVCDPASLPAALDGVDAVVHVAGLTKGLRADDLYRVNAYGSRLLAEAAIAAGVRRFVLCSSLAVAGPMQNGRPSLETDPCRPVSFYGRSKLAGEEMVRRHAGRLDITIVRPPIVYGPRDRDFFEVFKMAAGGLALRPGLFRQKKYSIIYVDDVGAALVLALDRGRTVRDLEGFEGVYYVSDGGVYAWEEMLRKVGYALGRRPLVVPVPEALSWPVGLWSEVAARITGKPQIVSLDKIREMGGPGWACSIDRAREELGFEPAWPLERGLASTADWYRANAWL
ncbi:MAG TPA: NAD-dependent epimerase/dehydratase family protein [Vulgatibacter sp.]|nr:NAD-dependent epimerase/dehydratase family protein [Vulgatibacter sp.]